MLSNENVSRVSKSLYPLGALLALVPLADLFVRVYPLRFGAPEWRIGVFVALIANFGIMLTGLGLAGVIAAVNEHRTVLRVLSILAAIGAVITLLVLVLFGLDTLQLRSAAPVGPMRGALLRGLVSGSVTTIFALVVLVSFMVASWRAGRTVSRSRSASTSAGEAGAARGGAPLAAPAGMVVPKRARQS